MENGNGEKAKHPPLVDTSFVVLENSFGGFAFSERICPSLRLLAWPFRRSFLGDNSRDALQSQCSPRTLKECSSKTRLEGFFARA